MCAPECARFVTFSKKSGNPHVYSRGLSPTTQTDSFLISILHSLEIFGGAVSSLPINGCVKKHCITLWSKRKRIKVIISKPSYAPLMSYIPQSMIVTNTRMLLFSVKIPQIEQLSSWNVKLSKPPPISSVCAELIFLLRFMLQSQCNKTNQRL